jgi:hypothetical protein
MDSDRGVNRGFWFGHDVGGLVHFSTSGGGRYDITTVAPLDRHYCLLGIFRIPS